MPSPRSGQQRARGNQAVDTAEYQPIAIDWASPEQEQAFRYGPRPLCCSGGYGAAKTWALSLKALWLSTTYRRNRGVIARKIGKHLRLSTQATFFNLCPPALYRERDGGRRADAEGILRLGQQYGGSEILWMHLEDNDALTVARGLEINWFILDQAEEMDEEVFDTLMVRLGRWKAAEVPRWIMEESGGPAAWPYRAPDGSALVPTYPMIACNPDHRLHWIYRRFHPDSPEHHERDKPELDAVTGLATGRLVSYADLGYRMIAMNSLDNKHLPAQNRQQLLQRDEAFIRRFVRGEWGITEGQIHTVVPESMVPGTVCLARHLIRSGALTRTLDHGDASPTACCWWITDHDANVWLVAEYYRANLLVSQHRRNLREIEGALQQTAGVPALRYRGQLADPSMFHKTNQKYGGIYSISDDYEDRQRDHGFRDDDAIVWQPADNDELGTRNIISEYLKPQGTGGRWTAAEPPEGMRADHLVRWRETKEEPRVHPVSRQLGYWPRLFFLTRTPDWPLGAERVPLETSAQQRLKLQDGAGFSDDRDDKVPDHGYDALRYEMASRAGKPAAQPQRYGRNTFFGQRDEYLKWRRRGGQEKMIQRVRRGA